jgi:hypothetical protein
MNEIYASQMTDSFTANALGNVGSSPVKTLFTISHAQENAIYFDGANGDVGVPSLWTSYWDSDLDMVGQSPCFIDIPLKLIHHRFNSFTRTTALWLVSLKLQITNSRETQSSPEVRTTLPSPHSQPVRHLEQSNFAEPKPSRTCFSKK